MLWNVTQTNAMITAPVNMPSQKYAIPLISSSFICKSHCRPVSLGRLIIDNVEGEIGIVNACAAALNMCKFRRV